MSGMRVAVIPARGRSARIPRKNVKPFCGKPMVAWSIEAAHASGCFDRVIVSTEDPGIAALARRHGAETPFMRPVALADEHTGTLPVMRHAVEALAAHGAPAELVCCLYATAAFTRPEDLRKGLELLRTEGCHYVMPVTRYAFPIHRALRINPQRRIEMFHRDQFARRSQDLEHAYHDAGQFYWGRADAWRQERALYDVGTLPLVIPRSRVQDIDTPEDWAWAERLFRTLREEEASPEAAPEPVKPGEPVEPVRS